jgi:hypothetical protein
MATKINVIITENYVYATYVETICFKEKYSNADERWDQIDKARSTAFSYALAFGSVILGQIENYDLKTDDDIFEYLKLNK